MSIGKVGLNALGRLGNGLGNPDSGLPGIPVSQLEEAIVSEDDGGFILLETDTIIITET